MMKLSTNVVLRAVREAVRASEAPLVIAVSGGLDSMALLHAMAAVGRRRLAMVATFDHGSGPAASSAAEHVAQVAAALGLPVVIGRASADSPVTDGREAAWRRDRYGFLRGVARPLGARILTAHTEDDQVETVLMRVLRGSGARGLAGLYAPSDIVRPLIGVRRADLERFATERGLEWRTDPGNASRAFLRNRIRLDLLPAMRKASPGIDETLLELARRAADWRRGMDRFVAEQVQPQRTADGSLAVRATELAGHEVDSLCVIWSALAARAGVALDQRGTRRLAAFTMKTPHGGLVTLSGGWYMEARRGHYILGKRSRVTTVPAELPSTGELQWGRFRFRVADGTWASAGTESWQASLSTVEPSVVRAWHAGDRLGRSGGLGARRVKRYLSDAGVRGLDRAEWPVVLGAEGEVVWIPGVRRADAATERSGRPVRHYICERITR
jgi:tRNA(Ile)-lysidine synthase